MSEENDNSAKILDAIEKLKLSARPCKDKWDKTAIISQIVASVVLASVGGYLTYHFQTAAAKDTLDATNRTIISDYLSKIVSATTPQQRAQYISALDVELGPTYSVPLAVSFARPVQNRDIICGGTIVYDKETDEEAVQEELVRAAANELLQRLSLTQIARDQFKKISQVETQPDAGIADAYLGMKASTIQYRVSEVDDFADAEIDDADGDITPVGAYKFGDNSPWVNISAKTKRNQINTFVLVVRNKTGGSGARLQMSIGAYQYDRAVKTQNDEPAGRMFRFSIYFSVDEHGIARFNGDDIKPFENMNKHEKCP